MWKSVERSALGREQVYQYLREAILSGELKAREKLVETQYSELFNVSRTPIREAFRMLEKDGLIQYIPQRGAFVRDELTGEEISEIFLVRRALQMKSVPGIIENCTDEDIAYMEECLKEGQAAVEAQDFKAYVRANNRFNHRLLLSSKMPVLMSTLLRMETYHPVFSFIEEMTPNARFLSQKHRCEMALNEHRAILDSMKKRDRKQLKKALAAHIDETEKSYLHSIRFRDKDGGQVSR